MDHPIDPAQRPSRLPLFIHAAVILLLLLAFTSGVLVWYAKTLNEGADEPVFNARGWVILHGCLNPFLCIIFGYLLSQHIRYGWEFRSNWKTGLFMELVFATLILSGTSSYYAPDAWRGTIVTIHQYTGLCVPIALGLHWIASLIWVKTLNK